MLKWFKIVFIDGKEDYVIGYTILHALTNGGYTSGSILLIECWDEVVEIPRNYKKCVYEKRDGTKEDLSDKTEFYKLLFMALDSNQKIAEFRIGVTSFKISIHEGLTKVIYKEEVA